MDALAADGWKVVALDVRPVPDERVDVHTVAADLLEGNLVRERLAPFSISHLFYTVQYQSWRPLDRRPPNVRSLRRQVRLAARALPLLELVPPAARALYAKAALESGAADPEGRNRAMLENLLTALEGKSHALRHVCVVTGGKHYGMHLGPRLFKEHETPYREDESPRCPGPNWYYENEDMLRRWAGQWTWTIFRPSFIVGYGLGSPYNFGCSLAAYAALCRALEMPLAFFGDERNANCRWCVTSAKQLARMMIWASRAPAAANQAFNCTGLEPFQWRDLWPEIAAWFELEPAWPKKGVSMTRFFAEHRPLWEKLVARHGLRTDPLHELASGDFIDRSMAIDWDAVYDMSKAHSAGFDHYPSAAETFTALFQELRDTGVIPK
ncbi:MAG: hypothetical protein CME06_02500 [Gemmatimonadetes bacterium]|nr:hypothetical protein [Gemmatimonadota bacterium]